MEKDLRYRHSGHLQAAMKRCGYSNKEIATAFKVSVRFIQCVKVPSSVEVVLGKKQAKRIRRTETEAIFPRTLL